MNIYHKICSCCKISKPESEFYKTKAKKDGLQMYCKICIKLTPEEKKKIKNKLQKNIPIDPAGYKTCLKCDELKLITDFYNGKRRCKFCSHGTLPPKEQSPEGFKFCPKCKELKSHDQYWKNRYRCKKCLSKKKHREPDVDGHKTCNKCKVSKPHKEFSVNNAEKDRLSRTCKICARKLSKEKYKNNLLYRLRNQISSLIRISIRLNGFNKKSKTREILGCSYEEFKIHMESKFIDGMTWKNRHLWEIDHIIPVSRGKTEEEIIKLNHYTNLQPLWAEDNNIKLDRYEGDNISILKLHEELGVGFRFTPKGHQHYLELESKKQKR